MTTVACNRREMAADSLAVSSNRKFRTRKLYRVRSALLAVAGLMDNALMFVHWYDLGANLDNRPHGFDGSALVLGDNGIFRYEGNCYPIPVIDEFAAIGSGGDIALAAMRLGKSPAEAVALACEIDLHTGPPVVVETL